MRSKRTLNLIVLLVLAIVLLPWGQRTYAASVSVTSTTDVNDGDQEYAQKDDPTGCQYTPHRYSGV